MRKIRKSDCIYVKSMDVLRPFIHLASYGCYSRMQIKKRLHCASMYDRRLELLNFSLSPSYWKCVTEKKKHRFFFYGQAYETLTNYVYPLFSMKSIDIQHVLCDFTILDIIAASPQGLLQKELVDAVNNRFMTTFEDIDREKCQVFPVSSGKKEAYQLLSYYIHADYLPWNSQIIRRLHNLENYGYIERIRKKYFMKPYPLFDFSAEEKKELYYAITFYSSVFPLSLPGYDLLKSLRLSQAAYPQKHLARNANITNIVNDDSLYLLQAAVSQGASVSFRYHHTQKKWTGIPVQIKFDYYQRSYVVIQINKSLMTFKIAYITDIQIGKKSPNYIPSPRIPSNLATIILKLHYTSSQNHQDILDAIHNHCPYAEEYGQKEQSSFCRIRTEDVLALVPWLRTLHPQVIVVADDKGNKVRTRMIQDLQETLQNYDGLI